jgi:hypothetical protein
MLFGSQCVLLLLLLLLLEYCFCFVLARSFITLVQSHRNTMLRYSLLLQLCVLLWDKETGWLICVQIRRGVDSKLKFTLTLDGLRGLYFLEYWLTYTKDTTHWIVSSLHTIFFGIL